MTGLVGPEGEVWLAGVALLERLGPYWERRGEWVYRTADGRAGPSFSGRFLADLALGYLAYGLFLGERKYLVRIPFFVEAIISRQDGSGAFRWNLPDPGAVHRDGVCDQVDLAMVVDTLATFLRLDVLSALQRKRVAGTILRAVRFLDAMRLPEYPGVIMKRFYENAEALPVDVLNGDALAACAFDLAARLPGGERYKGASEPFLDHLRARLGQHEAGWWPYTERLGSRAVHPPGGEVPTVFFQSMMILHLRALAMRRGCGALERAVDVATNAVGGCVSARGEIDPAFESRQECRGKPNVLVADALRLRFPSVATASLRRIAQCHCDASGAVVDGAGRALDDKWRIWAFSDVARMLLSMARCAR